jgi:hypothetical protein
MAVISGPAECIALASILTGCILHYVIVVDSGIGWDMIVIIDLECAAKSARVTITVVATKVRTKTLM